MVHTAFLALRRTAVDAKLHQRQSPKRIRACLALMQVRVEPRYLTKRERRSMTCCHN